MDRAGMQIQLIVDDLDVTEAFYAGLLDIPCERAITSVGVPEHLVMTQGPCSVIFVEEGPVLRAHPILGDRLSIFPKGVGMTLHLAVTGIREIYQALLDEDLEILYPLEHKPYGALEFWCFDPDGYLVVLEEPTRR